MHTGTSCWGTHICTWPTLFSRCVHPKYIPVLLCTNISTEGPQWTRVVLVFPSYTDTLISNQVWLFISTTQRVKDLHTQHTEWNPFQWGTATSRDLQTRYYNNSSANSMLWLFKAGICLAPVRCLPLPQREVSEMTLDQQQRGHPEFGCNKSGM